MSEGGWRAVLVALAASQLAICAWMLVSPSTFFDSLGGFGGQNDHYIRDSAVFFLAIGAGLIGAVRRPTWRAPVLAVSAVWYLAHAFNHLVDIGDSDPRWAGPADFASILLAGIAFALLAWLAVREGSRSVAAAEPGPSPERR